MVCYRHLFTKITVLSRGRLGSFSVTHLVGLSVFHAETLNSLVDLDPSYNLSYVMVQEFN